MDTGLIHIYCGDGKGKTTAAVGLTIRCVGRGGRVVFAQFLKTRETGELAVLQQLDAVTVMRGEGPSKFTFQMTPDELEETKRQQRALFHEIVEHCRRETPDMLVLDEAPAGVPSGTTPGRRTAFLPPYPARYAGSRPDRPRPVRAPARPGRLRIGNPQAQASLRQGNCSPCRH